MAILVRMTRSVLVDGTTHATIPDPPQNIIAVRNDGRNPGLDLVVANC